MKSTRKTSVVGAVAAWVLLAASGIPAWAQLDCSASATAPDFGGNAAGGLHALPADRDAAQMAPHGGSHGQLLLGRESLYLYHLPLFMTAPREHPHNFQVILEVEFGSTEGAAGATYMEDRGRHAEALYSAVPDLFDQTSLVLDYPGHSPLRALPVSVVRGHFERPPFERIIDETSLDITRVVHFREFVAGGEKLEPLSYLLFGRGGELFMAHLLSAPPDFDQILEVELAGGDLPAEAESGGLYLSFSGVANEVADRLRNGDSFGCRFDSGAPDPPQMELRVAREVYCEVGEVAQVGFAPSRPCPAAAGQ